MIITGKIIDATTREPLDLTSVVFKKTPTVGTSANSSGEFSLNDSENDPSEIVLFTHVDYNDIEYTVDELPAVVLMAKTGNTIAEVIVSAHKVMQKRGFWAFAIISLIAIVVLLNFKKLMKWSTVSVLLLASFSMGCSSVKKVNKDEEKQLKVINAYVKNHPYKNDTAYKYVKGDTIRTTEVHSDTVFRANSSDTTIRYKIITNSLVQKYYIHDTTETTVVDRANEEALRQVISGKEIDINDRDMQLQQGKTQVEKCKTETETYKRKSQRWFFLFIILLGINTVYAYLKIKKVI